MAFDALHRARDLLVDALTDDLPAHLTTVGTEQGITLPVLRGVYRGEPEGGWAFPCAEIGGLTGSFESITHAAIATDVSPWVIIHVAHDKPSTRIALLEGYLTALVRLLSIRGGDCYVMVPEAFDTSPPFATDTETVQSIGLQVRVKFAETR
jgi:hypothetical protein